MTRPLCAICDLTNQTTALCDACRADPANQGWETSWEALWDDFEPGEGKRLADMIGRRQRAPGRLARDVYELSLHGERVRTQVYFRGKRWGHRLRTRALRSAEIARRVGCHRSYVSKLRRGW